MTPHSKNLTVVDAQSQALEAQFEKFESAWRAGSPPDVEQFISEVSSDASLSGALTDPQRRQQFLSELVAIDLERHWRVDRGRAPDAAARPKPKVEDYLRKFPALASGQSLVDLIGHEYRTRALWGDAPEHAEYLSRFSEHAIAVRSELARVDREIASGRLERAKPAADTDGGDVSNHLAVTVDSDQSPTVNDKAPQLPERIGRFKVLEVLGSGGFGIVFRAFDSDLQREVAIKVPRGDLIRARGGTAAYLEEARTIAKLDHPGIVPVYEAGCTSDAQCYVVTKLMSGRNLAHLIASNRPDHQRAAGMVARIAEALHHAHMRGVVHRDIKPANILLDAEGHPLVADFGLAMHEEDFASGAGFVGTLSYMSPEQARDAGHLADPRSDVFSLGLVLFELLTGRSPYRAKSKEALVEEISGSDPRPMRQIDAAVPQELDRICQKARARQPSDRYATAQDFASDLRAYLRNLAKPAVPAWALPAGAAAVAALLLVGIGGYWLSRGTSGEGAPGGTTAVAAAGPAKEAPAELAAPFLALDHVVLDGDTPRLQEVTKADMPLPQGDRVALDVHFPKGEQGYLYLFQYDAGRAPKRLWPPADADLARQKAIKHLRFPGQRDVVALSSRSPRTMIVAAVSSTPLSAADLADVERVAFPLDGEDAQKPYFELVFPPDQRPALRSEAPRSIVQLDKVRLASRPERELQKHFDAFTALVFSLQSSEPN